MGPFEGLGPDIVEDTRHIKSHDGPNLILWGRSTLTSTLLEYGLADEVWLIVYPVLLGLGKRFFSEGTPPLSFELAAAPPEQTHREATPDSSRCCAQTTTCREPTNLTLTVKQDRR
jgi:dihydrofolate reductase